MSLSKFNKEVNNHQSLPDKPTLTADELKAIWDKAVADIKEYINGTLTAEIDTELGKKANNSHVYQKTEIDNLLESKANSVDVKLKEDFAYIEGVATFDVNTFRVSIEYPSGFNRENCVLISSLIDYEIPHENYTVFLGHTLVIYRPLDGESQKVSVTYRIVLMKIS